jgi:DNA-binding XRE family transcriptional regulator
MKSREITKSRPGDTSMPLGFLARNLRIYLDLSQNEVAKLAKVSPKSVDLLEHNQPIILDDKRKIMKELYLRKASKFS